MAKFAGVTLRDQPGGFTVWSRIDAGARCWPRLPGLSRIREVPDDHHHIVPVDRHATYIVAAYLAGAAR